ncbi:MAG: polyprenol monophosphomannose synthase [Anaerolineaceae bacterium]|nr:polyprenol monophosphomannose synthase [Anaerolineaceae bacterium]MCB9098917.1 polyprenol monophosphomannose synthase [Anaerolineales bacterium]
MKTVVVIPTYNEANNISAITAELLTLNVDDLHVLVVDDASPDNTGQIVEQLAERCYPGRLHVIHRQGKQGLGTAYIAGFSWALDNGAKYIVQMDADFSHSPHYIPQMLAKIADCDVVIGSRYIDGGQLDERWSWWRWFLSWWANSIWTRGILGVETKDATAGFKCWKRSALERIGLERINSNGYVFQVEMAFVSEKLNLRIVEIPIYFEDRRIGKSKMSVPVKIEAALRVFEIRWRHRKVQPIPLPRSAEI